MDQKTKKDLEALAEMFQRRQGIADKLVEDDPNLSPITAIIIAGDMESADKAYSLMESKGVTYQRASVLVGSYARLDFAMRAYENGYVDLDTLLDDLPELWRGSDPDDTDPRFLDLWKRAWIRNKRHYIRDGKALPSRQYLNIYRGQKESDTYGIAWSLDPKIAQKFARGAGTRQADYPGVVYRARVARAKVYAYLTGRGESEVIVDPIWLLPPEGK